MRTHIIRTSLVLIFGVYTACNSSTLSNVLPDSIDTKKSNTSTTIVGEDTLIRLIPEKWDLMPSNQERTPTIDRRRSAYSYSRSAYSYYGNEMDLSHIPESFSIDKTKDIGEIPISQSNSNGALTYSVPIEVGQTGNGVSPSIQLVYNSLSGNGVAGTGWQLGGLSVIAGSNSTQYYEGYISPVKANISGSWTLDGLKLIKLTTSSSSINYQTVQGNIKVTAFISGDVIKYYKAFYPNGNVATFGFEENTVPKLSYPITKIVDLAGNVINYSYTEINNNYYVTEINYGGLDGDSSRNNYSKVSFDYTTRTDVTSIYISGFKVQQDQRLNNVNTYINGELLRTYHLTYNIVQSESQLAQIDCSSGGKSFNPLKFYYGENNKIIRFEKNSVLLFSYFSNSSAKDLILTKGKFDSFSSNDGLISYPNFSTYGLLVTKKNFWGAVVGVKYGSTYSPSQELLVYSDLPSGFSMPCKLTAEEGFQLLSAIDIDGDGKDELVKMNSAEVTSTVERMTYKVYDIQSRLGSSFPSLRYSFDINYGGVVNTSGLYSPSMKAILTGDFTGSGKQSILTITYNRNIKDEDVQSYATLVDFDTRNRYLLYNRPCFSLSRNDEVFVMDYDGDGKADICRKTGTNTEVYTFDNAGCLNRIATYGAIDVASKKMLLGDVNGDGKTDIIVSPTQGYFPNMQPVYCEVCDWCVYRGGLGCENPTYYQPDYVPGNNVWTAYYSKGNDTGFQLHSFTSAAYELDTKLVMQDMNNDGRADLVVNNKGVVNLYLSVNGQISEIPGAETISLTGGSEAFLIPGSVESGYKMSQLFSVYNYELDAITFTENKAKDRLLTGAITSTGLVNKHYYGEINNNENVYERGAAVNYPYRTLSGNLFLQSSSESYLSGNAITSTSYKYNRGIIDLRGKGFLGFDKIETYDNIRNNTITQNYKPTYYGVLDRVDSPTASATYSYYFYESENRIATVNLIRKIETDKLSNVAVTSDYTYDSYGNVLSEIKNLGNGLSVSSVNEYTNHTGAIYKLGELYNQTITHTRGSQTSVSRKYIPVFSNTRMPIVTVNYVNGHKVSEVVHIYQNGQIIRQNERAYSASNSMETRFEYDDFNRIVSKTSPLGQTTRYSYDAYGRIVSMTDHKNNITQYNYDAWGRKIGTVFPDGRVESTMMQWVQRGADGNLINSMNTTGNLAAQSNNDIILSDLMDVGQQLVAGNSITLKPGFSFIASSANDLSLKIDKAAIVMPPPSSSNSESGANGEYMVLVTNRTTGAPVSQQYVNALGQVLRAGSMRFDGSYLYTDKLYDNYGRLSQVSLPFKGSVATQWNSYAYDQYDRPISIAYASGKTDTYSYNGLSATSTVDGIAKTTTKDATGKVVSITDPAGTISYALRADGQPSAIVAPGGITTRFEYDEYGRQTKLIDPSAGTRTYTYDLAGNINSETDERGVVTRTVYDSYNRVIQKEIVGELITDYVYNTDGQLSTVTSSNGTGKVFTYDALMRLTSSKESAPDGKYLQKEYTYHSGISTSISYKSQNGDLATEDFSYSNGVMSEIKLNKTTSIWKITEENSMGVTTKALTGGLQREYGFDSFGTPTSRVVKFGTTTIQNFGYNIDHLTGNLIWRRDNTRNLQEDFSYDYLNRLTGFGGNTITYDIKGNITDHTAVGSFEYNNTSKPYAITTVTPYGDAIPLRSQDITYNGMQRPATITENGYVANFVYDDGGNRVKMQLAHNGTSQLTRYYLGQYEYDSETATERLYLDGDAYSAASVLVKDAAGSKIYYICRDYQGSITHVVNEDGSLKQELSYDPWGRLRNPATQQVYAVGTEPALFLGRGYTGHEHLTVFSLINMNARLYDPALGRFLSPDPYVQSPDNSQNFNRYSYCLNNPLRYSDPSGKFIPIIVAAAIGAIMNIGIQAYSGNINSIGGFFMAAGIGALSGAAGGYLGGVVGGALGKATSLVSAIQNGAIIGAAGGAAGGFVGGTGNAWMNGANFGDGLKTGILGGTFGALAGGLIGGVVGGVNYGKQLYFFMKGCKELGVNPSEAVPATDEFTLKAQKVWYPDAPIEKATKFTVENTGTKFTGGHSGDGGLTVALESNGRLTGSANIYFNNNIAYSSARQLYNVMGHELMHLSQISSLAGQNSSILKDAVFHNMMEFHAYNYRSAVNSPMFSREEIVQFSTQYPSYYQSLSAVNFPWTFNTSFKYPF